MSAVEAELATWRHNPFTGKTKQPVAGMWFTEADRADRYGDRFCAMCGGADDRLVRDHCHATGLVRGLICAPCNNLEGRCDSPAGIARPGGAS